MITGEHCVIRTAEQDDALVMKRLYDPRRPCSALLDRRRELLVPSVDELREVLSRKDAQRGLFYAVEDRQGAVRGFCSVRGSHPEAAYAEFVTMLFEDEDFGAPLAEEVSAFLLERAFRQLRLNKVAAQCLDSERAYRGYLTGHGFQSEGVQRDVYFSLGRWFSMETLSLLRTEYDALAAAAPAN